MGFLTLHCCWKTSPTNSSAVIGYSSIASVKCKFQRLDSLKFVQANSSSRLSVNGRAFLSQNLIKKSRSRKKGQKNIALQPNKRLPDAYDGNAGSSSSEDDYVQNSNEVTTIDNSESSITAPSRDVVLRACMVTSGLIAALGFVIRLVSHIASTEGWLINDCSEISFSFMTWHLELITGLVILISSLRYLLLKTWPDFADSSEATNQQVLSSLKPLDYFVVAFLPGISEEFLFRGALLPLVGINWKSALIVAALFGILHLGNGRNYAFVLWSTFVGFAYGCATLSSSSIIVPMASHAINNLVGGLIWRHTSPSSR